MSLMTGEIHGLQISLLGGPDDEIHIQPGRCRDFDDVRDIHVSRGDPKVVVPARVGLGGLDTGSVKPNTSYAVYLVRQGNECEGMISKAFDANSADPPSFPNDGSLAYRRIGAVVTDAEGRLVRAEVMGDDRDRSYRYVGDGASLALAAASELTSFDLAPLVHRFAKRARIAVAPSMGPVTIAWDAAGAGATVVDAPTTLTVDLSGDGNPTLGWYRGSATVRVEGFEEML